MQKTDVLNVLCSVWSCVCVCVSTYSASVAAVTVSSIVNEIVVGGIELAGNSADVTIHGLRSARKGRKIACQTVIYMVY
jgi:hypothetical protein